MINSIVKIVCSSGEPLDITTEGLDQLRKMGYRVDNKKLDTKIIGDIRDIMMDDISLLINFSETSAKIIAHSHGKGPEDKRGNRYYFLYSVNNIGTSINLLDILKDFIYKADEEGKRYNFEIIKNDKESLSLFENLDNIINNTILPIIRFGEDLPGAILSYFDKGQQPQFETGAVDKAINFFIGLDSKIGHKNICYILYIPKRSSIAKGVNTINVYINRDRYIADVEPIKEFNAYIQNYKRNKSDNEIIKKIGDIQKDIEPGITKSHDTWKSQRRDLGPEFRKRLAENLDKPIRDFADDIESEIKTYTTSDSDEIQKVPKSGKYRWYLMLVASIGLVGIIGFISGIYVGVYVESNKIDIPGVPIHTPVSIPTIVPANTTSDLIPANTTSALIPANTTSALIPANTTSALIPANTTSAPNMTSPIPTKTIKSNNSKNST